MVSGFSKDINGLRAIAVISVVIYHFNSGWFSGEFAGVDIFFVVLGFLIDSMMISNINFNGFKLLDFYLACFNRIVPALAALCIVLLVLGWFYLLPIEYQALGKYLASSLAFISNIIYWREDGYFSVGTNQKWLLHTWSLSVEWQFYLLYLIVLMLVNRFFGLKGIRWFIGAGAILAFTASALASYKWPVSLFFLLPTRAWRPLSTLTQPDFACRIRL